MRGVSLVAVAMLVVSSLALAAQGQAKTFVFAKADEGKLTAGWKIDKAGEGEPGVWKVIADATWPGKRVFVLAQTSPSAKTIFNLCVVEGEGPRDVELSVAFRAYKGEVDQGGGVVWRYQDANNYYLARMNPLEE